MLEKGVAHFPSVWMRKLFYIFVLMAFAMKLAKAQSPVTHTFPSRDTNKHFRNTNTLTKTKTVVLWDGVKYPFTVAGFNSAIAAACNGAETGKLVLPPDIPSGLVTSTLSIPSNCWVDGAGKHVSVIQASASLDSPVVNSIGTNHVRLTNFGVDGNRSDNGGSNINTFDCIDIGIGSTYVTLDGMRESNCRNQSVLIAPGDAHIYISNSEQDHNGSATISSGGTGSIAIAGAIGTSHGPIDDVQIGPNNFFHDNNQDLYALNSSSAAEPITRLNVFNNVFQNSANDAIAFFTTTFTGGKIIAPQATGNKIDCMGWLGNTRTNCTPGFLQTGAGSSAGGVGVDVITTGDQLVIHTLIANNVCRDSTYECVATTSDIQAAVTITAGTSVTWNSGPQFKTTWRSGQSVQVLSNLTLYKIASVSSPTSMTLQTSAPSGSQTLVLPTFMWATVKGNQSYNNGSPAANQGPGIFCDLADGNNYNQNEMVGNYEEGMQLFGCSFATSLGDKAYSNDKSHSAAGKPCNTSHNFGILVCGALGDQLFATATDDPEAFPTQTVGVFIDATATNTSVKSTSLSGSTAPIINNGTNSSIDLRISLPSR